MTKNNLGQELSKEQIEYFKNSKVVDKEGNLLVCYHGTPQQGFKEFDAWKGDSQFGKYKFKNANVNYFTTNKKAAASYTDVGYENDGNVYACYVNIVNPYVVNSETEVDINTSFNIKDKRLRERQIELFDKLIGKYEWKSIEDLDLEEFNEDLLTLNLEARIEDEYLVIYELGKNSMFGAERPVYSQYTDEDLFDNFYDVEDFQGDVIGEVDDYYFSTDDIVRYVLSLDEDYDGIIIEDIFDSKSPFSGTGTDVITLRSSNQIKEISNLNPTSSNRIDEELKQEELQKIIDVINKYSKVKVTTDSIKEVNKEDDGSYYINFYSSKGNDIQPEIPYEDEDKEKYNEMLNELASLGYKKPIRTSWLRVYGPHGHNKAIWWIQLKPKAKIELTEDSSSDILYRVESDEYNPSGKFYATTKEDAEQYGDNVKEYKLKSGANIYSGNNSEYYCIENNLEDVKFDILQKTFGIDKLNDMYKKFSVNGKDVEGYTFHDNDRYIPNDLAEKTMEGLWAYQLVAKEDLSNKGYDGAFWKYEDGTIDKQYQIWNQDVVEEISLKESFDWDSMEEVDNEEYNEKSTIKNILDIWYGVNSLEEIQLYHGTTKDNWEKIQEEGMLKAQELYGPNTKIGDKGVYLTTSKDDAKEYVSRMHEEDAIVLEIEVNKLDFDKLYVDLNEIYRVMIDEDGKEYWDIFNFVYIDNIPLDAIKDNSLQESKADSEGKIYYRFSLEDAFGDNKGGIFGSSAMWDLIYSVDEDDQDDVDRANMLEEILDSLMHDHKVPNEWYQDSKFAFSEKFVEEHKEDFEIIRDILDFWDYALIIDKINKDEVEVTYEDEDQIAYKLKEELNESKADLEKFRQWAGDELADRFYKQKDRLEGKEKDIYYWMSRGEAGKQELLMTLRDYEKMPTRKEVDQKGKEGAVKIYEDDEWLVYHITSYEGAVKYGKGTRWCISASKSYEGGMLGRDFWNGYSDSEIYFYINKKNDSKYALVYDSEDHWTIYDDADYEEVAPYFDYANDEDSWNPYDASKPHFPDVKGLPDINAEYDRAEREIKAMEEGLKEAQLIKTKTINYKDYWGKDKSYQSQEYKPRQDSKYKRLIKKPINTLTLDEITYIYLIQEAWKKQNVEWFENTDAAKLNAWVKDKEDELKECYEWLHSLTFPLTVYRGIRVGNYKSSELNTDTDELNISGRQRSYSWTTDINIYKDGHSKFRKLVDIYACEIDSDIIDVANTIDNFIFYTSNQYKQGYGEYEITLKDHFKMSDLHNLRKINKEEVEGLEEELEESLNNYDIPVYRVDSRQGEGNDEWKNDIRFFADSLEYYDHSDTRYDKNKAKKYLLNTKDFKVFDPMVEWKDSLYVESWSVIRTTEEFCDEKGLQIADYLDGVDYDNPNEYHEVLIDTDILAAYGLDNGYDITIIRDIPQYYVNSYGEHDYSDRDRKYTEYAVHNSNAVKLANAKKFDKGSSKVDEELSPDMSEEEIKALVDKYFTEENLNKVLPQLEAKEGFYGKCFIDAKGKVYDVQKLANAHDSFLMDVFDDCYRTAEGKYPNWDDLEEIEDKYDIGAIIVDAIWDKLYDMNWIQCSNEIGGYIALRGRTITEDQFNAMETWISNLYEHGGDSVEISLYTPTGWKSKRYLLKDNLPEDIVKKIKRASKSGYLPESLKQIDGIEYEAFYTNNAKELNDWLSNEGFARFVWFGPEDIYIVSNDYIHSDLGEIGYEELGCSSTENSFIYYGDFYDDGIDEKDIERFKDELGVDEGTIYVYENAMIFDRDNSFKDTSFYKYLGEAKEEIPYKKLFFESLNEDYGYHAGDLGKSEYYGSQTGGRNTGHFGTGTYFVGNPEKIKNYNKRDGENAPQHKVDFSKYHLYKPSNNDIAYDLHDTLGLLDGVYTWYLPILKEITNVVSQAEKYIYDGQPIQNLSEFIDDLNKCEAYYDEESIDKEKALRYLDEEEFDKYLDEIDPDEWDNAWEEKYALEKVFNDKLKRYKNWRISTDVNKINNIVEELYKALEGKHTKEEIQNALNKVVEVSKEYKTRNADKEDSLATVFMKALGYEGVDTRHLNKDENGTAGLDNTSYGSVIYDLKPDTVVECLDEELLSTEEFDMFVAESPYQAKNYLLGQTEAQRIFADENQPIYLIAPSYETIHSDMTAFARDCGYNAKMDDFDSKKACLIFVPDTEEFFDEEGDAFDDEYDYKYVFNGGQFVIYSRYQDFSNFELCKAFGNDYEEYHRVDEDSDAYREGILFEKMSPKFNLQSFLKERLENYKVEGNKTITTKISR